MTSYDPAPALFVAPQHEHAPGAIESSVLDVVASLTEQGLMTGKYQAIGTSVISIARAVDTGMVGGKRGVSVATANLAKLLVETLENLPEPVVGQDPFYDALDAQLAALTQESLP